MEFPEIQATEHPKADDLSRYYQGQLSAASEREIRDHIVDCCDCAALLLELSSLFQVSAADPTEMPEVQAGETHRATMPGRQQAANDIADRQGSRFGRAWTGSPLWVAAAVLILAVGLGSNLFDRNDPSGSVALSSSSRGAQEAVPTIDFAQGAVELRMATSRLGPLKVEVVSSDGRPVQTFDRIRPQNGRVTVTVEDIAPGFYRVLLVDIEPSGTAGNTLEEYAVRVGQPS